MSIGYGDRAAWAAGHDRVYRLLAAAALDLLPGDLSGRLVLDASAGTGTVTRLLRERGARTVAVDLSAGMLSRAPAPAAVGDLSRLPLRDAAVDGAVACLVLSHVPDPRRALAELVRVTRPGATVLATAFPAGSSHRVKSIADRVLAADGYRAPDWYAALKTVGEARVGTPERLLALAAGAGLTDPTVAELKVDLSTVSLDALVAWRLGMAPVAAYLAGLDPVRRQRLRERVTAETARVQQVEPLPLLSLQGRACPAGREPRAPGGWRF